MRIGRLTALAVQRANKQGMIGDGLGLYLQVGPNAAKSWILRFKRGGKSRYLGLGPVHTVSLAQARQKAADARSLLLEGTDPIAHKRASRAAAVAAKTFKEVADDYIAAHRAGWRSAKHAAQWEGSLAKHVYPVIGAVGVAAIDTTHVLKVLRPIWSVVPETGSRIRSRIELVLDAAKAAGLRDDSPNPARWKGHLKT
ncbi:MAG: Arm DNA-binding domain-containing protein, partial [Roseiarcus sp.]